MEMPSTRRRRRRGRPPPFRCFCPHQFTGRLCEILRRSVARVRCSSGPCLAGGRCRDLPNKSGYVCICPRGLWGYSCGLKRLSVYCMRPMRAHPFCEMACNREHCIYQLLPPAKIFFTKLRHSHCALPHTCHFNL